MHGSCRQLRIHNVMAVCGVWSIGFPARTQLQDKMPTPLAIKWVWKAKVLWGHNNQRERERCFLWKVYVSVSLAMMIREYVRGRVGNLQVVEWMLTERYNPATSPRLVHCNERIYKNVGRYMYMCMWLETYALCFGKPIPMSTCRESLLRLMVCDRVLSTPLLVTFRGGTAMGGSLFDMVSVCVCVRESVCMCVWGRVCEGVYVCVWGRVVRVWGRMHVCVWGRVCAVCVRESACVCVRESVACVCERECCKYTTSKSVC